VIAIVVCSIFHVWHNRLSCKSHSYSLNSRNRHRLDSALVTVFPSSIKSNVMTRSTQLSLLQTFPKIEFCCICIRDFLFLERSSIDQVDCKDKNLPKILFALLCTCSLQFRFYCLLSKPCAIVSLSNLLTSTSLTSSGRTVNHLT
jgi:hypothetical protein